MSHAASPIAGSAVPSQVQLADASVTLFAAAEPAPLETLERAEREAAERMGGRARAQYLRGRAALKACLRQLGVDSDTTLLQMPHRQVSLTHAAGAAVAAYTRAARVIGVGVDFEPHGPIAGRLARFFLTERELATRIAEPEHGDQLLRLWTVKEALYKATHDNEHFTVRDYECHDAWRWEGSASLLSRPEIAFRYVTMTAMDGYLSVAVASAQAAVCAPTVYPLR